MASKRSTSDPEIERVNPGVELVTFHGMSACYSPDADVVVTYSLGSDVTPSDRDWVGLFQTGWGTTEDYLTYVWAPNKTKRPSPAKREVVFAANRLQALKTSDRSYQFLYVSRGNFVAGVSRVFQLSAPDTASPCLSASHASSFSLVSSNVSIDTQGFEDLGELGDDDSSESTESDHKCSRLQEKVPEVKKSDASPVLTQPPCQDEATPRKKPVIIAGKSKRSVKITHDSATLSGSFEDATPFEAQLFVTNSHPIVREYMDNKEQSLMEYKPLPVYSLRQSQPCKPNQQEIPENSTIRLTREILPPVVSIDQSWTWPQLEQFPLFDQYSVGNSLAELYRRQLNLSKTEIKDLEMDVICLKKGLHARDELLRIHRLREAKQRKTEATIEEVLSQMGCLKSDITNLLQQNGALETEGDQLKSQLKACGERLEESEARCCQAEKQLHDVFFSLSMKGCNSVVDFSGKNINLSEIQGEKMDVEGWKVYKTKRCGRLLAVINRQERSIESLQTSLGESGELCGKVQEELAETQQLLQETKEQMKETEELLTGVKQALDASLTREDHAARMLASAESELVQYKYDAETREHHLLKEVRELRQELMKNQPSAMTAFTNKLVTTGLASFPDMSKMNWCSGLCPKYNKDPEPSVPQPFERKSPKPRTKDSISWENEEPIAKQPKVGKKATKRSHKETERHVKSPEKGGRTLHKTFPENCPVCSISFANAVDNRVVDEHLAFHDIYRM